MHKRARTLRTSGRRMFYRVEYVIPANKRLNPRTDYPRNLTYAISRHGGSHGNARDIRSRIHALRIYRYRVRGNWYLNILRCDFLPRKDLWSRLIPRETKYRRLPNKSGASTRSNSCVGRATSPSRIFTLRCLNGSVRRAGGRAVV